MKIEKGTLQVDIREAFSSLSSEDKREVAKIIAFDNALIEAMCKLLTKSEIVWSDDEYEQAWYCSSTGTKNSDCLEPARIALLPLMPEIATRFIAQLIRERDSAHRLADQWRNHCWELQDRWSDTKRPSDTIDYSRPPLLSQEQVEALLKEWESSPTPDLTSRIEAAAEEIAKEIKLAYGIETDERDVSDITAIIRRHLEVK